jgi:DNA adenine methylase
MYRLNQLGQFNVPYGGGERTPAILWTTDLLREASNALRGITFRKEDFENALERSKAGDVIYCDPTYSVAHGSNGFVRYNERNFAWSDQERLARAARRAAGRGAFVIISNAHHASIRDLYRDAKLLTVERRSAIAPDPGHRCSVREYLILLG